MSMDRNDPVQRQMQREARRRVKQEGAKYTEALRQVKAEYAAAAAVPAEEDAS